MSRLCLCQVVLSTVLATTVWTATPARAQGDPCADTTERPEPRQNTQEPDPHTSPPSTESASDDAAACAENASCSSDANDSDTLWLDGDVVKPSVIVVTAPAPLPASPGVREVGAETLATASRRSADDLLRLVPGLHSSAHGAEGKGQQFFWRGFDAVHGADIEIRVAGVAINELSNVHGQGYVDLGFVIAEAVRTVVSHKGSFALEQGNFAVAGSIDLELGVPPALRGHRVLYEAGTSNRHRVLGMWAPRGMHTATFAAVEALHDSGYGTNRGVQRLSALGQVHREIGAGAWLEALLSVYGARFGEPAPLPLADFQAGLIDYYDSYSRDTQGRSSRVVTALRLHREATAQRSDAIAHVQWRGLALDEDFTGYFLYPELGDRRLQAHESIRGGVELSHEHDVSQPWLRWPPGHALVVAGAGATIERMRQREDQITAGGVAWQHNRALDAVQAAMHARLGVQLTTGDITARAGARLDAFAFDANDELDPTRQDADVMAAVSPRLSVAWQASHEWSLTAAYGRGVRAPEARSVTIRDPVSSDDPDVRLYDGGEPRISTSDAVELGARWRPSSTVRLGGGVFAMVLGNEMLFDHVSGVNVALDRSRRVGVEMELEVQARDWLLFRGDASAVDARFVASGNPVPGAPRIMATAEAWLGSAASRWRAGAQYRYLAPRPLAHGATASAVSVLDATAEVRWYDWQLGIQIDNVLTTRWREGEYHFASHFDRDQPRSVLPRVHFAPGRPFGVRASLTRWF